MGPRVMLKSVMSSILVTGLLLTLVGEPADAGYAMDTDLADVSASFIGEDAGDRSGYSVAGAGDVNGDGYNDILIGAYRDSDAGGQAGQVYLVFGSRSGWSMDTDLSRANASFIGEAPGDYLGDSVAGAGDVNGDGYDDIIVSAPLNDEGGNNTGQVYLVLGRASGWSMDSNLSSVTASFWGESANSRAGFSLAGAGDVNGDGYDDILIGSIWSSSTTYFLGRTYLVLGKASGWSMDTNLSNADATFTGEAYEDVAGYDVAGTGDVNGDGYDDILVAAPYNDEGGHTAGQVYLILGRGTGWSQAANLSNANASFCGERAGDFAGGSVAGAGDVNGDGFDDILIGASANDDGQKEAGQSYLILGKATGWSMDTNLSTADASFRGERKDSGCGRSVGGAGDVNADGYDDILIGAFGDSEGGGTYTGQTYIILGKAAGWSTDTNISGANCSFLGESAGDSSGYSLAGAGDVNGDGYDDILIGAYRNDEGGNESGQTYVVMSDYTPPVIEMVSTPKVATTGDEFVFNVFASDGVAITNVTVEYWYGFFPIHSNVSVDLESGDTQNGTWALEITIPANSTDALHFIIHARDGVDHVTSTVNMTVQVLDDDAPAIIDQAFQNESTTGDGFTIAAVVTDNINVSTVWVEHWFGSGPHTHVFMIEVIPGFWGLLIPVPSDSLDTLHYVIHAKDSSSNAAATEVTNIPVIDDDPPEFIRDTTGMNATAGQGHMFEVEVTDNVKLANVTMEYWIGTQGSHQNASMTHDLGVEWELFIWVPRDAFEALYYIVHARDNSSNENSTSVRGINVWDVEPPVFGEDRTPPTATTGELLTFSVNSMDHVRLSEVRVVYRYGDTGVPENASMRSGPGDLWSLTINVRSDAIETLHYHFYAEDHSSNFARTRSKDILVVDNDLPVFGDDGTPAPATTGDPLTFSIVIEDNIGIMGADLNYRYGEGAYSVIPLVPGEPWEVTIIVDDTLEDLEYFITVDDTSGNGNATAVRTITIIDNDPPEVIEDLSDTSATTGEVYHARVRVRDNVGIDTVTSTAAWTPTDVDENGNGVYEFEIPIDADYVGRFYLGITITDLAGNEAYIELESREVVDNDAPMMGLQQVIEEAIKGSELRLEPVAMDNIGVEAVYIVYRYGDGAPTNRTMDNFILLDIPRHPEGKLYFHFVAIDTAGNWGTSGKYIIDLVNAPPEIDDLPTWEVMEETDAEFDLSPYVTDPNDEVLTVSCSDGPVTIEGMVLKLRHDEAVPDRTVTLTVSDGEDGTEVTLTIHVVNVNDLPVITNLLPADGTKVRKGETIVFTVNATDEEGDDLTFTWKEGEKVLSYKMPFEWSKLSKGEHTITVVVDDGTGTTEESFTVKVIEEEESPGFGLVMLVLAVVSAAVIAIARRDHCRVRDN